MKEMKWQEGDREEAESNRMNRRVADRGGDGVCVAIECILISVNFTAELTQLSVYWALRPDQTL